MKKYPLFFLLFFCFPLCVQAEVLVLQNGDRLTGAITRETPKVIFLQHESLGKLKVPKSQIKQFPSDKPSPSPDEEKRKKGDLEWKRKAAAGVEIARGNTEFTRWGADYELNRNRRWIDEWTLKGGATVEKSREELTVQKANNMVRYGYSITKKVYNFYRVNTEHDYFENLKLRVTPSTGVGYWFADTPSFKLLGEPGIGYEWEFLRPDGVEHGAIGHLRGMISKKIGERTEVGLDHYYFPKLTEFKNYRMETEAFWRLKLTEHLNYVLKIQNQYHSQPLNGRAKKNDFLLGSKLEYSF